MSDTFERRPREIEVKANHLGMARAACPDLSGSRPLWHGHLARAPSPSPALARASLRCAQGRFCPRYNFSPPSAGEAICFSINLTPDAWRLPFCRRHFSFDTLHLSMVAYEGCRRRARAKGRSRGRRKGPDRGEGGRKQKKDVFLTKRTQLSVANKGLSVLERKKRTGF